MATELPRRIASGARRSRGAVLPSAANVPRVRPPSDPGVARQGVPSGAFGGQEAAALEDIGGAVADFGVTVAQVSKRAAKARRDAAVSTATARATSDLKTFVADLDQDPDFETFPQRFKDRAEAALATHGQGLDEKGQLTFRTNFERLSLEQALQVRKVGNKRVVDLATADLDETLDRFAGVAAEAGTGAEHDLSVALATQAIDDAAASGIITAEEAGNRKRAFAGRLDEVAALQEISRDPVAAADMLADSTIFPNLDEKRRLALFEAANRKAVSAATKAERAGEKALAADQAFRAAELTDGILEGTVDDVELDRALSSREINGSQFIAARKLLNAELEEEATTDDPNVVLGLTRDIENGVLTKGDVLDAFADKQITAATMNRLRGEIDRGPDDARTKEQRRMLQDAVAGTSGLGAILGEDTTRRVNQAVQEYNERVRGGGKEDPLDVRRDIESRAAEPRSLDSLFRPRFMVGPDKENMDPQATKKATLKAYRARQITTDQLRRELDTIKQIEAAQARQ